MLCLLSQPNMHVPNSYVQKLTSVSCHTTEVHRSPASHICREACDYLNYLKAGFLWHRLKCRVSVRVTWACSRQVVGWHLIHSRSSFLQNHLELWWEHKQSLKHGLQQEERNLKRLYSAWYVIQLSMGWPLSLSRPLCAKLLNKQWELEHLLEIESDG